MLKREKVNVDKFEKNINFKHRNLLRRNNVFDVIKKKKISIK